VCVCVCVHWCKCTQDIQRKTRLIRTGASSFLTSSVLAAASQRRWTSAPKYEQSPSSPPAVRARRAHRSRSTFQFVSLHLHSSVFTPHIVPPRVADVKCPLFFLQPPTLNIVHHSPFASFPLFSSLSFIDLFFHQFVCRLFTSPSLKLTVDTKCSPLFSPTPPTFFSPLVLVPSIHLPSALSLLFPW